MFAAPHPCAPLDAERSFASMQRLSQADVHNAAHAALAAGANVLVANATPGGARAVAAHFALADGEAPVRALPPLRPAARAAPRAAPQAVEAITNYNRVEVAPQPPGAVAGTIAKLACTHIAGAGFGQRAKGFESAMELMRRNAPQVLTYGPSVRCHAQLHAHPDNQHANFLAVETAVPCKPELLPQVRRAVRRDMPAQAWLTRMTPEHWQTCLQRQRDIESLMSTALPFHAERYFATQLRGESAERAQAVQDAVHAAPIADVRAAIQAHLCRKGACAEAAL